MNPGGAGPGERPPGTPRGPEGPRDFVTGALAADADGVLTGLALARSSVDRASARRDDTEWLAAAWADQGTRVLVLDGAQALVRFGDDAAELVLVPPSQAPEGVRFLLGVDDADVVYFAVAGPKGGLGAGPLPVPGSTPEAAPAPGVRPAGLREAGTLLGDRDAGPVSYTHLTLPTILLV